MSAHQIGDAAAQPSDKLGSIPSGGHGFLRQKLRVDAGNSQGGCSRLDVDADDAGTFVIEMQKGRLAAARQLSSSTFDNPAFRNELLGDGRDGAALKARAARQSGAGDGLMLTDQIENDPFVNITGRFTPRDLEVI